MAGGRFIPAINPSKRCSTNSISCVTCREVRAALKWTMHMQEYHAILEISSSSMQWCIFNSSKACLAARTKSLLLVHRRISCLFMCSDFFIRESTFIDNSSAVSNHFAFPSLFQGLFDRWASACQCLINPKVDSLVANEVCQDMHWGAICLFDLVTCFASFSILNFFMSLIWQRDQFMCNVVWHFLATCVPLQWKWDRHSYVNGLWTS